MLVRIGALDAGVGAGEDKDVTTLGFWSSSEDVQLRCQVKRRGTIQLDDHTDEGGR